jgi:hypothetical protein
MDPIFLPRNFFEKSRAVRRISQRRTPTRCKRGCTMRPRSLAMGWGPSLPSWVQSMQTWVWRNRLDLKLTIKGTLPYDLVMRRRRNKIIHNTNLQTVRIGGETLPEPLSVAPSPPWTPSPSAPWWRGSSPYLDYVIAELFCINLSLVFH